MNTTTPRIYDFKKGFSNLFCILLIAFIIFTSNILAQTTSTFTTTGSNTWVCPTGVTSIQVESWGAGGAGGNGGASNANAGGGGGGGAYTKNTSVTVTPGTTYTITVGAGGTAAATVGSNGNPGGNSIAIFGTTTVTANGGAGGIGYTGGGAGSAGGAAGTFAGGNGAAGNSATGCGGGGGEGAGTTATGGNASGVTGGSGTNGGDGGTYVGCGNSGGGGVAGTAVGGGGSGSVKNFFAGAGARGQVTLTFTCPATTTANAGTDQTLAACTTTATLAGNTPTVGTGTWTVVSGSATITSPNSPTSTITGLTIGASATLRWTIANGVCGGSNSDDVIITTVAGIGCWSYCTPTGANLYGYISNVNVNSGAINRTSTWDGYINTGLSASLVQCSTYTLSISMSNTSTTGRWTAVWIDWNNNGVLNDAGEDVLPTAISTVSGTDTRTISFTVPAGAVVGTTKMRVVHTYQGGSYAAPDPCTAAYSGSSDWEDYTITVTASSSVPSCASGLSPASGTSYSCGSPTTLSWSAACGATGYKVYLQAGTNPPTTLVSTQTGTTYVPGTLSANTTYYWKVVPYNGYGDATGCSVQSFTTGTAVTAPTAPNVSYCSGPYAFNLSASGGTYSNYFWFDGSNNFLASGSAYTTPSISSTTSYYVLDASEGSSVTLTGGTGSSYYGASTSAGGGMFNLTTGSNAIALTSLDVKVPLAGTYTVEMYYKSGTYVGSETSSGSWTLFSTSSVTFASAGTLVNVPVSTGQLYIPANTTDGFYVTTTTGYGLEGTSGSPTYSDANVTWTGGSFDQYGFTSPISGYNLSGKIYYNVVSCQSALTTCQAIIDGSVTGGSNYGIYAPDGTATVTDCEIINATSTICGGVACKVCTPSSTGYTSVLIDAMTVIYSGDATNNYTNCTSTAMNMTTAAGSPDWTGSTSPLTGTGSPKTVTYTTTGRKTVDLAPAVSNTVTLFSDDFEGSAAGWTGQATGVPSSSQNYWVMKTNGSTAKSGWLTGYVNCGTNDWVLTGAYSPRVSYYKASNPGSGLYCDYSAAATTTTNLRLVSPSFSTVGYTGMTLTFNYVGAMNASDNVQLQYSTDGATWTSIAGELYNGSVTTTTLRTVTLPAGCDGKATLYLGWNFNSSSGTASSAPPTFIIDDIAVKKTISVSNVYTDFNNMMMAPPAAGSLLGVTPLCPNISGTFSSSTAGTTGFTYVWTAGPTVANAGHVATITTNTASSTPIAFTNTTTAAITYTVHCVITSPCCGPLTPPTDYTVTVNPNPVAPTAASATTCPTTSSATLTATAPSNSSFNWYTASSGGTLLSSGASYIVSPTVTTSYWVEATSTNGCVGPRAQVTVTVNTPTVPAVASTSICGSGNMTLSISSPVAGYTYNWYTGSCGGTLVQSSTGTSYTAYFNSTTTFYISATSSASGCPASSCTTATATVGSPPNPIYWLGTVSGLNNWFNTANWTSGCLPTCASDVVIVPNGGTVIAQPDIGYNAGGAAACKKITLQASTTLSFSDSKGELDVCGDFIHDGDFKTSNSTNGFTLGKVVFMGTAGQNYANSHSFSNTSNFFNDVIINNTTSISTTPNGVTLSYSSAGKGNMTLGTAGNFTFQSGKVYTLTTDTVVILNPAITSVSGHSSSSYISGGTTTSTANNGKGNLKRYINSTGSYDFPVGQATYELNNINFTTAPTTALKWLNANFNAYSSLPGPTNETECSVTYNVNALDNGYWDISAYTSYNNTGKYDMTAYNTGYTNASSGWTIMAQHNGSSTWSVINGDGSTGLCVNTPVTAVLRQYMTGFSHFGIAQSSVVLPIELLSFKAIYNGKTVDVNWLTATEINNSYFNVEKSMDGKSFSFMKRVETKAPNGNSSSNLNYAANDADVSSGNTYYYRLKQVDINGTFKYSPIAPVTIGASVENIFVVKPNPTSKSADVTYECYSTENATLKVFDDRGRLVLVKEMSCQRGTNTTTIDLSEQPEGMYFIVLSANNNVYKTKLIKTSGN